LLGLAERSGARVLTPLLGRPFEPAHIEAPVAWWRAVETAAQAGAARALVAKTGR
jgi:hypothetical protein